MENKISENVRRNLINCHLLIVTFVPDFYFKKFEMKLRLRWLSLPFTFFLIRVGSFQKVCFPWPPLISFFVDHIVGIINVLNKSLKLMWVM
jgi:hypothetical protein